MLRIVSLTLTVSAFAALPAAADEVRRGAFEATLIGTWAQSADLCAKDDKSNFAITASSYTGPDGTCAVEAIIETPAPKGANYSVRGRCQGSPQDQPHVASVIMRPDGADQMSIGSSFAELKPYQRCPAK